MRLTRAAEYAIRCVTYLSRKGYAIAIPKQEIVKQAEIPASFLAKIAQDLSRAGMIEIKQGPKGGYQLSKHPVDISLLEVVEVMIGEICLNDCVGKPSSCPSSPRCLIHKVWDNASAQLRANLASVNFSQLSQEAHCFTEFTAFGS